MFLVSDTVEIRHEKIRSFISQKEPAIAVLLAAADCERTLRRAIVSLGISPTKIVAEKLAKHSGLDGYKCVWNCEIYPWLGIRLSDRCVISHWSDLRQAFKLRHRLIHGVTGTTGLSYALDRVETMLEATVRVNDFAQQHGYDLCANIKRRIKARKI